MSEPIQDKPPTQSVGVTGFDNFATPADNRPLINWGVVAALSPFQMFIRECMEADNCLPSPQDLHMATGPYILQCLDKYTEQGFFQKYVDWHKAKGQWPNEDAWGNLL